MASQDLCHPGGLAHTPFHPRATSGVQTSSLLSNPTVPRGGASFIGWLQGSTRLRSLSLLCLK